MPTPMPTSMKGFNDKGVRRLMGFAALKIFSFVFIAELSKRMRNK